jgi:hypothetical protein
MTSLQKYGVSVRDLNDLALLMSNRPELDLIDALEEIGIETGYLEMDQIKALHRDYGRDYGDTES